MENQNRQVLFTPERVASIREEAYLVASGLQTRQLFTHMAIMNALVWRAAANYDIGNRDSFTKEKWENMLLVSVNQELEIVLATKWLGEYIQNNWKGAYYNRVTLFTYRKIHINWGFFWYDVDSRPKSAAWGKANGVEGQGVATPPTLERLDVAKILIYYHVFDHVRRDRINQKLECSEKITAFDCMPEHGGAMMVSFYNALFLHLSDYWGNHFSEPAGIAVVSAEKPLPVHKAIIWKWNNLKGVFRVIWQRMVAKAGHIPEKAKQIMIPHPLGVMADVPY